MPPETNAPSPIYVLNVGVKYNPGSLPLVIIVKFKGCAPEPKNTAKSPPIPIDILSAIMALAIVLFHIDSSVLSLDSYKYEFINGSHDWLT
ncbi:hypothetical protein D3C86_1972880 [compost metagenome]